MVVGGGRMGEALVGGLIGAGRDAASIAVVEPSGSRRDELAATFGGLRVLAELPDERIAEAVVAVKPDVVASVCGALGRAGAERILSIAAGVRLGAMEAELPDGVAVVRAMPNTPALVGLGAAAIAGGTAAGEVDMTWAESILGAIGLVVRVTEAHLDAVTGLSGSGPAYVFLVAEALIDAGVEQGLGRQVSTDLAIQTLRGAAEMLATGTPPAELRAAVTSPGGTTAAGLRALEDSAMRAAFAAAVAAATRRSRELG